MFERSVTIFKISDIPIKLHISFLLVLPFLAWAFGNNIQVIAQMVDIPPEAINFSPYFLGFFLAILLFISVALHELAHSFVARSQGININSITLMLLGGVAQMEDITEDPKDEAWMAFAGPFFSLILGFFLLQITTFFSKQLVADLYLVVIYLGWLNIFLGFLNLLPAFPTDGGRILRALIARKKSAIEATRIASGIGKSFAFLFGIIGLISGNFFLIFIAFFIFIGASQEYQTNLIKKALSEFKVSEIMTEDVSSIHEENTVQELIDKMFDERHSGYPVIDNDGNIKGCVTMEDIQNIKSDESSEIKIQDIMTENIKKVSPDENIYQALKKLSEAKIGRLMVMENDNLVGIITRSDIMKAYRLNKLKEQNNIEKRSNTNK